MMMYASQFASTHMGIIGLLFFFIFFVVMIAWVFRPGSKMKYQQDALIPLKDDDNE
jgi:cbb3-type cytochrome oxidase subunit 3